MMGTDNPAPFALPADSVEITLDLPPPPSTNRIWRFARGRVYRSKEYVAWIKEAALTILANRQVPKQKITGPFEIEISLATNIHAGSDGDNRIKAVLDLLHRLGIIADDKHCRRGYWQWVVTAQAPLGCRVTLRSLHQ